MTYTPYMVLISTGIYGVATLLSVLYWVYIWQLKDYRTDRMRDFFSTSTGKKSLLNIWNMSLAVCIVVSFIIQFNPLIYPAIFLIYLLTLLKKRYRPIWTFKSVLIVGVSFSIAFAGPYVARFFIVHIIGTSTNSVSFLETLPSIEAIILFCTPLIVTAIVFVLRPITSIQKQKIIAEAKQRMNMLNTTVVGITGSYGKTSTKEFLSSMLSEKYSVLATPKNINVDIGVAQTILHSLQPDHDVFIVEMGAYAPGEIDAICDLVSPIIGVITAVREQHLSLFGSKEAIFEAKSELAQSLPKSGLAVLNLDDEGSQRMVGKTSAHTKFFSLYQHSHVFASDIVTTPHEVTFHLHVGKNASIPVTTKLHGQQVVPSILAAATVADHLGLSIQEIAHGIEKLKPVDNTMQLSMGKNHAWIIDDHYNSNPDGFIAALDYLDVFAGKKKVVLTPGMYELGGETEEKHRLVGKRIAEVADRLYITKKDFASPLRDAAIQAGMPEEAIIVSDTPRKIQRHIEKYIANNYTILIEGRVNQSIVQYLLER